MAMGKALKIADEAYAELTTAQKLAIRRAKEANNEELAQALVAMGMGAFTGWLIFRAIKRLEDGPEFISE